MDSLTDTTPRSRVVAVVTGSHGCARRVESWPWIIRALLDLGHEVVHYTVREERLALRLLGLCPDVIWPTGLGVGVEDGTLAGFFQTLLPDTPLVGSSVRASSIALDQEALQDALRALELAVPDNVCFLPTPTPSGTAFHVSKPADRFYLTADGQPDADRLVERLGWPLVVKPCAAWGQGGLTLVRDAATFARVVRATAERSGSLLVERYLPSYRPDTEVSFSVCLLEGEDPLPAFEVAAPALHDACASNGAPPHPISGALARRLQAAAWTIFDYLGCRGLAQVDFRVTPDETIYPLRVKTRPDLIKRVSLFPRAAALVGLSYEQVIARILASAFIEERRPAPRALAREAAPLPVEIERLLPDLPADLQTPDMYPPATPERPAVSRTRQQS